VSPRIDRGRLARHACDYSVRKGDELGHFKNGSTILLFASHDFEPCLSLVEGITVRAGQPLLRRVGARFSTPS
jgi:phosphatidylserine decarboxylase